MGQWMKVVVRLGALFAGIALSFAPALVSVMVVETSFDAETWIKNKEPIRIRFDRIPDPAEGKVAIFIGDTDLSSQSSCPFSRQRITPSSGPVIR